MHPEVSARLQEEIMNKVGPTCQPTYDDIRYMKYLRAVLNEVLRLFLPVPFNIREALVDLTWPATEPGEKPYFIPAGQADNFDPNRFLDERAQKYLIPDPFIFLPLNAGPRICLGQQFAYNEMSFFLIKLLQQFSSITHHPEAQDPATLPPAEWASGEGGKPIEKIRPRAHLTIYAMGGLWVKMQEAEEK